MSSNGTAILLSGAAGGGKSIITNMIQKYCQGYKWLFGSQFQNIDIINSSTIILEEVQMEKLKDS